MCFGEVAIMNMCKMRAAGISEEAIARRCVRMADVRALEPCELCALTLDDAWPLIREIPELWVAFEEIAQRRAIRAAVPQLASGKVPPARPPLTHEVHPLAAVSACRTAVG